jgi:protein TonB
VTAVPIALFPDDKHEDWARWSVATAIVAAAHAGAIASYLLSVPAQPPGAADAPAVILDLAPMPMTPASRADVASGPQMMESQSVPEPPKRIEAQPIEPAPKLEAPAELLLPAPEPKVEAKPEEKPVEKPRKVERPHRTPAPQNTAPPRSERRNAPVTRAPSAGSTEARAALAGWRDLVVARLHRAKRSDDARRAQGTAILSFSVDRNGRVLSQRIVKSSGRGDLEREVLALLQRAQPLPPFPPAMPQSVIQLTLPIEFSLR